jgi:hypothetical protein
MASSPFRFVALITTLVLSGCTAVAPDTGKGTDTSEGVSGADEDGDGYTESDGDCDDSDAAVNPDAEEICDGNDNDCDGEIDEDGANTYYADEDGDGFGDATVSIDACEPEEGWVENADDCDDTDANTYLGASEICDGEDNDCDGEVDEDLTTTVYADGDGDGYGDPDNSMEDCTGSATGYVDNADDCNDDESLAWTGAAEVCDGVDNDCNGEVDEGLTSTWYPDDDGDGYGDDSGAFDDCDDPGTGYLSTGGDCNDAEPLAYTGAAEVCDDVDNDCDGGVDNDAIDASYVIPDADSDGFGDPDTLTLSCDDGADNTLDCDDSNPFEPVVASATLGTSGGSGSATDPLDTIQGAIDQSTECVYAMADSYDEDIDFGGNSIWLFGDGPDQTWLTGTGDDAVVTIANGESVTISSLAIMGGGGHVEMATSTESPNSYTTCTETTYNYHGGGIYVSSSWLYGYDLMIEGNDLPPYAYAESGTCDTEYVHSYGGGLYANASSVDLYQVWLGDNSAEMGGAAAVVDGLSSWTNVVAAENSADSGGGIWSYADATTATNVTVAGNSSGDAGVYADGSSSVSATDTIAYGDSTADVDGGTATVSLSYSDVGTYGAGVTDQTGSSGNISADPDFVTPYTDLHLNAGSPAEGSGTAGGDMGAYGGAGGAW